MEAGRYEIKTRAKGQNGKNYAMPSDKQRLQRHFAWMKAQIINMYSTASRLAYTTGVNIPMPSKEKALAELADAYDYYVSNIEAKETKDILRRIY